MKKVLIFLLSGALFANCHEAQETLSPMPSGARQPAIYRTVGTGKGDLSVDGKQLGIKPGEVVVITPGRYKSLSFSNLTGRDGQPITLAANGLVELIGGYVSLENVAYLTIDGGASGKNFLFRDNNYRAITISGTIPRALTLRGIRMRNIADYAIFYNDRTNYDGTDATAFTDFKLLNCDFDNTGTVMFSGNLYADNGRVINNGFCRNPEVAYCSFTNSPDAGSVLYIGNGENMNIHHNVVNNVNARNNNHNGIFFLKGNGSVHHNKCTNHQGNFVRFWPFTVGTSPKEVLLYNNIVWNSRKYSALELQSFGYNLIPGVSTYCNAKVFNNTAGKLNTTRPTEFVGVVVDVYNLFGGRLDVFNNLSVSQVPTSANDGIWSQQNVTRPTTYVNNQYFRTPEEAGLSEQDGFRLTANSPVKRKGMYWSSLTDDYFGSRRNNPPSIGAAE